MIEKILERLEEERTKWKDIYELDRDRSLKNHYAMGRKRAFGDAIEIVQEVAKDGGWIPCSEQMPQENKLILIYAESMARGGSIRCVAELRNGFWFAQIASDTLGLTGIGQFKVIAWQPLPAPYRKGEEN